MSYHKTPVEVYPGGRKISLTAAANLTAGQVIAVDNTGKAAVAGAGDIPIGVVVADASQNAKATILVEGVVRVTAGAAVTSGTTVKAANGGKVVAVDWANDDPDLAFGVALTSASDDGDVILVLIK